VHESEVVEPLVAKASEDRVGTRVAGKLRWETRRLADDDLPSRHV
jgi:hypothetical protein